MKSRISLGAIGVLSIVCDNVLALELYSCNNHLRRLRQIRRRVGQEVATRLVLATVISRLDYCTNYYETC